MVFLPSRPTASAESLPDDRVWSRGVGTIIDLLDVVGTIRDGEHLQASVYLAEEFGLLAEPTFVFGSREGRPRRPHSLLLEGHFYALLCDKVIDRDGAGHLRPRRDLYSISHTGRVARRLRALNSLSPREALVFAAASMHLARQGCYAGSPRHDGAFQDAVSRAAIPDDDDAPTADISAIHAARQRLMQTEPVLVLSGRA